MDRSTVVTSELHIIEQKIKAYSNRKVLIDSFRIRVYLCTLICDSEVICKNLGFTAYCKLRQKLIYCSF